MHVDVSGAVLAQSDDASSAMHGQIPVGLAAKLDLGKAEVFVGTNDGRIEGWFVCHH